MSTSPFKDDIFAGKVAFVTGGGSGICKGITEALLSHGATAAILGRKADRLADAAQELASRTGKRCIAIPCDVRDPAAVQAAIARTIEELGRLDIVVNGAAGNFLCPAAQLSPNGFKTVLEIDTVGTFHVCRAAFDAYLRDHGGVILNVSATLHRGATPLQIHASAAKAAIDSMTRTMALEWASLGVRVVGVAPGPIDETEGMSKLAPGDAKKKLEAAIPIGRFGTIEEIANVSVFLCSDAARLIHGETVVADGAAWFAAARALMT